VNMRHNRSVMLPASKRNDHPETDADLRLHLQWNGIGEQTV